MLLTIGELADAIGVSVVTLRRWDKAGRVVAKLRTAGGHDQALDLTRQKERLEKHLEGEPNALIITDLGSGLNFKKRGLSRLLGLILSGQVARLVVTHKDRLLRFGYELIERLVHEHGGVIEVLDDVAGAEDAELAKDVLTIVTVFAARLYGRRSHRKTRQAA